MKNMLSELGTSLVATLALAIIVCGVYPLMVWGIAQVMFPNKVNGSLIMRGDEVMGSELIAQHFSGPRYFHPRPSAAGEVGYDGASSGGSNLGPLSKKLMDEVKERVEKYRTENGLPETVRVPADAVTTSGSGLDPHISLPNALLQAARVAKKRALSDDAVKKTIAEHTEGRDLGIFGHERVNVLKLNLALDGKL